MLKVLVASAAIVVGSGASAYAGDDMPGPGWITMDQALHDLHRLGYREVVKLEAEDGYWKAKASKGGAIFKIHLDPRSGAIVSSHRDHDDD